MLITSLFHSNIVLSTSEKLFSPWTCLELVWLVAWCWVKLQRNQGLFGSCFQELFSVLENKKHKKLVLGRRYIFVFCVFCILKNHFFENNKNIFSLFFHYSKNILFFVFSLPSFCVFLVVFYISTKVSSTQPSHPHPQIFSSSLYYWNLYTYIWWQNHHLFKKIITSVKIFK